MSDYLFNEERLREIHYRNLNRQEIAKAHQQGLQQGEQRMQEVAINALQMGLTVEQLVAKMTGLSVDDVKSLAEKK